MPVPTIDLLPEVPIRGAPTFSPQMNLFLSALPTFQTQTNASIGAINTAVTNVQADVEAAAASASSASGFATTAVNAKNDAVQAKEDAQDILVLVENIAAGISFTSTSTTSLTVEVGSKTWTVQTDESYAAGMPIAAVKAGDPDVYMVGICTAYTGDQLTVAVSQVKGSGSVSNWNISIGGIPGLPGPTFTGGTLTTAMNGAPPVTIASASTVAIGAAAANDITISGTTTITAFDTIAAGAERRVTFSGVLTLTHNGTSLILPGAANITTAAGDVATFLSLGSGNWRCVDYQRASGSAVVGSNAIGDVVISTQAPATGTWLRSGVYATSSYTALAALLGTISDVNYLSNFNAGSTSGGTGSGINVATGIGDAGSCMSGNNVIWLAQQEIVTAGETAGMAQQAYASYVSLGVSGYNAIGVYAVGDGRVVAVFSSGSNTHYAVSTNHGISWTSGVAVYNFNAQTFGLVGGKFVVAGIHPSTNQAVVATSPSNSGSVWTSKTVTNNGDASSSNSNRLAPHGNTSRMATSWHACSLVSTDGGETWARTASPYQVPDSFLGIGATNGKTALLTRNPSAYDGSNVRWAFCRDVTASPMVFEPLFPEKSRFASNPSLGQAPVYHQGYYWGSMYDSSGAWIYKINASDPADVTFICGYSWMANTGSTAFAKGKAVLGIVNISSNQMSWFYSCSYLPSTQFFVPPAKPPVGTNAYMRAL